jgi:glycosyltransferase involved in cell wall biosynthesis
VQAEIGRLGIPESQLPHVRVFDDAIPEARLPGFYTAADAYVSPTRGEGWGRPLMEAVACGAPVIASRWSAHLAFLDDRNATLVDGQVVDVPADVDIAVFRGMRWFDPDVDALRAALRAVRSDPEGARARAVASRPALVEEFALPAIAERVAELVLEAL